MRPSIILTILSFLPALLAIPHSEKKPYPLIAPKIRSTTSYCPGYPASEIQQRQIFLDFVNEFYVQKNVIGAFDTYVALNLTEHSPFSQQGRVANEEFLAQIIPFAAASVLRTSFDNNIGLAHIRINVTGGEPIALADIYRMSGTCIVEHWDVTQARPANATNPIAMF